MLEAFLSILCIVFVVLFFIKANELRKRDAAEMRALLEEEQDEHHYA